MRGMRAADRRRHASRSFILYCKPQSSERGQNNTVAKTTTITFSMLREIGHGAVSLGQGAGTTGGSGGLLLRAV